MRMAPFILVIIPIMFNEVLPLRLLAVINGAYSILLSIVSNNSCKRVWSASALICSIPS